MSFQDESSLLCSVTGFDVPLCQYIAGLKSCANVHKQVYFDFFLQTNNIIEEVTDATEGIIVMSLNLPSLSSGYENISLMAEFGSGSFPFLLLPWPPARQVPAVALPVPTQTGGLGRGAEEFWLGTLHVLRQPGGKEGNTVGAKHNANTDCFFWKGANPGATTEALLCCWDNSTVHCVAPKSVQ